MIHVVKMNFSYSKKKTLFENFDLDIENGGIVGLLGMNGVGKTTLLKLITGLIFPKSGTINVLGETPQERLPRFLQDVYFVPDELAMPMMKGEKFVRLYSPFYPKFDMALFKTLIEEFEVDDTQNIAKMSLGQKKKFIISFALATKSRLLVFEEPTNGMDIPSKNIFRKVTASVLNDDQLIIISTHQVADINKLIDRVIILDKGEVKLNDSTWDISQKYAFVTTDTEEGALYAEQAPGGYRAVVPANGQQTEIDLELLFNARKNLK